MIKRGHQNIIFVNSHLLAEEDLDREVGRLEAMIRPRFELSSLAPVTEIADLNHYRLVDDTHKVLRKMHAKDYLKPFVFLINRN